MLPSARGTDGIRQSICLFVSDGWRQEHSWVPLRSTTMFSLSHAAAYKLQVALCIHFALQTQANIGQGFVETLDDVEHVDADVSVGKNLTGNRNKADMHVTAEVFYSLALSGRKLPKVSFDIVRADLRKNIHDIALVTIAVDDVAAISVAMPAFLLIIPFTGIALELIDAKGFGQVLRSTKGNAVEHMLHNGDGDVQHCSDTPKRRCVHQGFAKLVIQGEGHAKRGMDPIGVLHESSLACFTVQPPLVECHHCDAVMSRSMAEGLQIARILDVAFIGTTVRTDSMHRRIADDQVFVIVVWEMISTIRTLVGKLGILLSFFSRLLLAAIG